MNSKFKKVATQGLLEQNPVFRLALGMCPSLAITTLASNAIGMGAAVIVVLFFSNLFISLLRNIIPSKVRIPAYIIIIATFVTIVQMSIYKWFPDLYDKLGVFIPLIVVNCLIFARAEAFAGKEPVGLSMIDALSMGVGYTLAIFILASIREILGNGTWFGMDLFGGGFPKMASMTISIGGFIGLGLCMALFSFVYKKIGDNIKAKKLNEKKAPKEA